MKLKSWAAMTTGDLRHFAKGYQHRIILARLFFGDTQVFRGISFGRETAGDQRWGLAG